MNRCPRSPLRPSRLPHPLPVRRRQRQPRRCGRSRPRRSVRRLRRSVRRLRQSARRLRWQRQPPTRRSPRCLPHRGLQGRKQTRRHGRPKKRESWQPPGGSRQGNLRKPPMKRAGSCFAKTKQSRPCALFASQCVSIPTPLMHGWGLPTFARSRATPRTRWKLFGRPRNFGECKTAVPGEAEVFPWVL
jgi:hypothetical protein